MGSRKRRAPPKTQNHAQDCGTLIEKRSASGDPAMVLMFRMASILSLVTGTVPVTPSGRIAAGRCPIEHDVFGKTVIDFSGFMLLRMIVFS
jgi:hypothetical protein